MFKTAPSKLGAGLAALTLSFPTCAGAQVTLFVGGEASVPVATYADVANLGAQGRLGAYGGLAERVVLAGSAFFNTNPHELSGDRSDVYGFVVRAGYRVLEAQRLVVTPWAGIGGVVHARRSDTLPGLDASRRGLALTFGATIARSLGRVSPYVSAFYQRGLGELNDNSYPTEWVSIGAGLEIPLRID